MEDRERAMRRHLATAALLLAAAPAAAQDHDEILEAITLPEGFNISVFAEVPGARSIALTEPGGPIFIGSRDGAVHSIRDADGDGVAEEVHERAADLNVPNGIAVRDGRLYLALQDRVAVWDAGAEGLAGEGRPEPLETVYDDFHDAYHHGWRYAKFGPDGRLYISLGAPCNICALTETTGKIISIAPDGSDMRLVADGVRNSVGFAWHPGTGVMYFTDNGADRMGDDIPPDELNAVETPGGHYGFPWRGGSVALTGYEDEEPPVEVIAPVVEFGAHTASLGLDFVDSAMLPEDWQGDAVVAQHGSWNRSTPIGYRLMRVRFGPDGTAQGREVFAEGWLLDNGNVLGRPVDVAQMPDGALLVTDDHAGLVYRITYE